MRVLIVVDHFWPSVGGVERLFAGLGQALVDQGMKVDVLTLHERGLALQESYKGMQIHRVRAGNRLLFGVLSIWKCWQLSKNADVIHASTYASALPAAIVSVLRRKPSILTIHEVLGRRWFSLPGLSKVKAFGYWITEQLVCRLPFDRYVCVSQATFDDFLRAFPAKKARAELVLNGLEYTQWERKPRTLDRISPERFLYYGRHGVTKGLDILLEAWQAVMKENPQLHLEVMLPESDHALVKTMLAGLGVQDSVFVLPSVSDAELMDQLRLAECVVVPSLTEGFGFAVLENVALGTPLVVTNAGSIPEVVSGKFVMAPAGNAEHLADAILKASRGAFSEREEKRFPIESTVSNYSSLYANLSSR